MHPVELAHTFYTSNIKFRLIFLFVFLISIQYSHISNLNSQPATLDWVDRFSWGGNNFAGGLSIKLDSLGSVYVLMQLSSDSAHGDFGLAKYSANGTLIWSTNYNGPGNLDDIPEAFVISSSGDAYITGRSGSNLGYHISTVKFNTNGVFQWIRTYSGAVNDIAIDKAGKIILIGGTYDGNVVAALAIKYDSNGDSLWVRKFNLFSNSCVSGKIALDDSGNVYTIGYVSYYNGFYSEYLTLKYASNGNLVWYSTYRSRPNNYSDIGQQIAVDTSRNVYVVGTNPSRTNLSNNTLVKMNPQGVILWAKAFTGINAGDSNCYIPTSMAVTKDANSVYYATSCANGTGGGAYDIVTLRYDPLGDSIWVRRFWGGVPGTNNAPAALKLDRNSNLYITGLAYYNGTGEDYVTIKYLPSGILQWTATYNGPISNSHDGARDLFLDSSFNVYVTGVSSRQSNPAIYDAATIKYSQPIGIINNNNEMPRAFKLEQNYPNPFNPVTVINYEIPVRKYVELKIYDLTGRIVRTLVSTYQLPGYYTMAFNAQDLASGVYFYVLNAETFTKTRKMILIK